MSDLHKLHVSASNQSQLEGVDQKFLAAGLLMARLKTIEVVEIISKQIKEGTGENEARALIKGIFREFGVTKHWHQPYLRFGEGSVLSFHEPISEHRLRANEIFHMDVGPVWSAESLGMEKGLEYEGDYGDSFVYGENKIAQKLIHATHEVFASARDKWKTEKCSGTELYEHSKEQAELRGYKFVEDVAGHRLGDFPHHKHTKERLGSVNFTPSDSLWVMEVMLLAPNLKIGAFFEDLLM